MKSLMRLTSAVFTVIILFAEIVIAQGPPVLVETEPVRMMEFHDQITLVGRTEAKIESRIVAEISGRVESVEKLEGVPVTKGSPLITIDADRIKLLLKAKKAETEQARLEAKLAQDHLERTKELFNKNVIPQTSLDSAVVKAGIYDARYEQLEAEKERLELDLYHYTIAAPFTGYTGQRLVDVGEWVNEGMPIFEMVDLSHILVRVDLPERYFGRLELGSPVEVSISNGKTLTLQGKVSGISPNASTETHNFPVLVDIPNPRGHLGSGMLVRATLTLDDKFSSFAVSKDAIVKQGIQSIVYTIGDGKAVPVPVETSSTEGKMIAIKGENVAEGMPVVVRGNERIFPGSPVRTPEKAGESDGDDIADATQPANGNSGEEK